MEKCRIHLAYLGRGLYVSLEPCKLHVITLPADEDVKLIVIGELTADESSTLNRIIKTRLGKAINREASSTSVKPEPIDI